MNFWFCEACGKRLTDKDLEEGSARNKKLKGVFCKECSIGVMTMEMDAVNPEQLTKAPAASAHNETASAPRKASEIIRSPEIPQRHAHGKPPLHARPGNFPALLAAGALVVVGGLAAWAVVSNHAAPRERVSQIPAKLSPPSSSSLPPPPQMILRDQSVPPVASVPEQPLPVNPVAIAPDQNAGANETPKAPDEKSPPVVTAPISSGTETRPAATVAGEKPPELPAQPIAVAHADKGGEEFAAILKELAPLLRQNRFVAGLELLDAKRRDAAYADAAELIDKEKSDLADIQTLRNGAMEALRAKAGKVVTLKKGTLTGTVRTETAQDGIMLALKDGPEFKITTGQLDADDVNNLLPPDTGAGKAEDLRRRGLLFLAAGETARAEDCFGKARDAGLGTAVAPYLERIAALKLVEREGAALETWKKAEGFFANKNWKAAKLAYETLERDYAGSAALVNNAELLKKRLEAIEWEFGPPRECSLDLGGGVKMELVLIPAGEFEMGSKDGNPDEKPVHKVKISHSFYMGKYDVTQAQYERVMGKGSNPSCFKGENLPVERVSYIDVEEFCKRAGKLTKQAIRLPAEAEWEYACRAGTKTKFYLGDNDMQEQVGWFKENSETKTHPVGQKKPNAWGLYDMQGNVWQWCEDWYGKDYYGKSEAENPQGPAQGTHRVMRGGSWNYPSGDCRSARRSMLRPDDMDSYIGFRAVVTPASKAP